MKNVVFVIQDWDPDKESRVSLYKCWIEDWLRYKFKYRLMHIDKIGSFDPYIKYITFASTKDYIEADPTHFDIVFDKKMLDNIKNGNIQLVLSESGESWHPDEPQCHHFYDVVDNVVGTKNVILISDLDADIAHECGLFSRFKGFVNVESLYIWADSFNMYTRDIYRDDLFGGENKKRFLCLNRNAANHRILLYILLNQEKMMNEFIFSMILAERTPPYNFSDFYHLSNWLNEHDNAVDIDSISKYTEQLPMVVDEPVDVIKSTSVTPVPSWCFDNTHMSIVTESHFNFSDSDNYIQNPFITEKTMIRLTNAHPFIILGDVGINRRIKKLGFTPYETLMLNDFDNELNPRKRFMMFFENVRLLYNMPENEFTALINDTKDIALENAKRARSSYLKLHRFYNVIKQIVSYT